MKITYRIGDATRPQGRGMKMIAHICNNIGAWGAGFVIALSKKWSQPEEQYRAMSDRSLGDVQFVDVAGDVSVANMIAQDDVISNTKRASKKSPIRYDALVDSLITVNLACNVLGASLHLPRIGSGLAGGNWTAIAALIEEHIDVPVYVYDLKKEEGTIYEYEYEK